MDEKARVLIPLPEQLVGERVLIRPWCSHDVAALWEALAESRNHLWPWLPWIRQYQSLEDVAHFIARAQARWLLREDLAMGIFHREGGRLLGGSGLHRIDWGLRRFEIGYWVRASAAGKGYITEAVQILTRLAFRDLGARRVEIRIDPRNQPSRRVAERIGFVYEGTLRNCALGPEGPEDRRVYALTPDDFARLPWAAEAGAGVVDPDVGSSDAHLGR